MCLPTDRKDYFSKDIIKILTAKQRAMEEQLKATTLAAIVEDTKRAVKNES